MKRNYEYKLKSSVYDRIEVRHIDLYAALFLALALVALVAWGLYQIGHPY